RQKFLPPQRFKSRIVHTGEIADKPETPFDIVVYQWSSRKKLGIRGTDSNCGKALRRNGRRQTLVEESCKDHHCRIPSFAIGNSQAADKLALNTEPLESFCKGPASPVNHQNVVTLVGKSSNAFREVFDQRGVLKQGAGKFNDNFHRRPVCSSSPSIRFRFCTACPAAPLPRLSRQETTMSRLPVESSAKPISQKLVFT